MHPTVAKIVRAAELLEQTQAWKAAMHERELHGSPPTRTMALIRAVTKNLARPSSQTSAETQACYKKQPVEPAAGAGDGGG